MLSTITDNSGNQEKLRFIREKYSRLIALLIITVILVFPASAFGYSTDTQDPLKLTLTTGRPEMVVNGETLPCVKPYKSGNIFYIPMKAVMETFGADVETASDRTIIVTYRDSVAKIKTGSVNITLNNENKRLAAPPILSGSTVMIPLEFVKLCFDIDFTLDNNTGKAVLLQKDDGSLTDLSFLTGSITTSRAGNSYFGWSLSLPKGTTIASQSFNSNYVQFENEHFGFDLEINIIRNTGKTLKDYYNQIKEDPTSLLDTEPMDSSLNLSANPQYIELLYNDTYNEAVYERIYVKGDTNFDVITTSFDEVDPAKLKNDKTIRTMLDSISLGYKGNSADTADLSSVKNGLARYSSFITSEFTGKKVLAWEMNTLPEWDLKGNSSSRPFNTEFDGNPGEYVRVELESADGKTDIGAAGKSLEESYLKNFNLQYFTLKSSGIAKYAGFQCYELLFGVKMGSKQYEYDERLILDNGILYDITFKSPESAFSKALENFNRMFGTFRTSSRDQDIIIDELQKNSFNQTKNSVGKDDTLAIYENKAYKWKLTLPGYWQKNGASGQSLENFYESKSGAVIAVEASALKAGDSEKTDQERFQLMRMSDKMTEKPVKSDTEQIKDRNVTFYQYRIDDAETETYADVNYYVFDEGGYRYCFMSTIPDLTSSEFNLNSLKSIWESFEIIK